jgi:hypothetical protein
MRALERIHLVDNYYNSFIFGEDLCIEEVANPSKEANEDDIYYFDENNFQYLISPACTIDESLHGHFLPGSTATEKQLWTFGS